MKRVLLLAALGSTLVVAGLVVSHYWRKPAAAPANVSGDPRLTFSTPYLNVQPSVKYVGDAHCRKCHFGHTESYAKHSMGRSAVPIRELSSRQHYDSATNNPFTSSGFWYEVEPASDRIIHKESHRSPEGKLLEIEKEEVAFAIGSGGRGISYAINHDGFLFQSPISWFSQKQRWDLSPGFQNRAAHFGRPLMPACLVCHCDNLQPVEHTANRYKEPLPQKLSLGCERCHGPGELHVQEQEANRNTPFTIVNPGRLEPRLREAVCQQCHLQGRIRVLSRDRQTYDYRPGLPLELFWDVYKSGSDADDFVKAVGHVEQMYVSRCFRASGEAGSRVREKLGCISCHDPHELPAAEKKVAYYRDRCLRCHQDAGCSLPLAVRREQNKEDSCIACHMPRAKAVDVVHLAVADHRILRNQGSLAAAGKSADKPGRVRAFESFFKGTSALSQQEAERNQGLALASAAKIMPEIPLRSQAIQEAEPLLASAVLAHPDDLAAWEALGYVYEKLGDAQAALNAYQTALRLADNSETALAGAATNSGALGQLTVALDYWQRTVAVNPWHASYQINMARLLGNGASWHEARDAARLAVRDEPTNLDYRLYLVLTELRAGNKEGALAQKEFFQCLPAEGRDYARRWLGEQGNLNADEKRLLSTAFGKP